MADRQTDRGADVCPGESGFRPSLRIHSPLAAAVAMPSIPLRGGAVTPPLSRHARPSKINIPRPSVRPSTLIHGLPAPLTHGLKQQSYHKILSQKGIWKLQHSRMQKVVFFYPFLIMFQFLNSIFRGYFTV